jgi:site-specific DNA recombinase
MPAPLRDGHPASLVLAAIYARVSTEEQSYGYSLQTQIDALLQYAAQYGLTVPEEHIYQDDVTGTTLHRPGLHRLRDAVEQRLIQAVLIYDLDRLARSQSLQMVLIDEFEAEGVIVYEYGTPPAKPSMERRMITQIKGVIGEYEVAKLRERTERGRRGKAKAGVPFRCRAPLGYRYVGDRQQGHYEVVPAEAQIVHDIFHWFVAEGLTLYQMTRRLNQRQVPTYHSRHGLRPTTSWYISSVYQILRNPAYIGTLYYGKTTRLPSRTQPNKRTRTVATDPATWVSIPIPPLLAEDVFAAAQARLKLNSARSPRNQKHAYLLGSGRLRCGLCGRKMGGTGGYYRCNERNDGVTRGCRRKLLARTIDPQVWQEVRKLIEHPHYVLSLLNQQQTPPATDTLRMERREIDKALQLLERKGRRLTDAYLDEAMPLGEFKLRKAALEADAALLRTRLEIVQAQEQGLAMDAAIRTQLHQAVQGMRTVIDEVHTLRDQHRILDTLGLEAIYEADGRLHLQITPMRITSTAVYCSGSKSPAAALTLSWALAS